MVIGPALDTVEAGSDPREYEAMFAMLNLSRGVSPGPQAQRFRSALLEMLPTMPGFELILMMRRTDGPLALLNVSVWDAPESFATAQKVFGAEMQRRLAPQSEGERARVIEAGLDLSQVLSAEELVGGEDAFFVATGVTGSDLLPGIAFEDGRATTWSMVTSARTGTARLVTTIHPCTSGDGERTES